MTQEEDGGVTQKNNNKEVVMDPIQISISPNPKSSKSSTSVEQVYAEQADQGEEKHGTAARNMEQLLDSGSENTGERNAFCSVSNL